MKKIEEKLYMLSPLEREILDTFLKRRVSWSAHEIWTGLINETFSRVMQECNKIISKGNEPNVNDFVTIELTISKYLPPKTVTLREIQSAIKEFQERYEKARGEKDILYSKLKFVRHFYRIPTVKKVEEAANSLVNLGILLKTSSTDKRVKSAYYINPIVIDKLRRLENEEQ